ncbi:protein patched homolog 1-like isoform X1 [Mya arenaria]|uniref:protein patched homolog 1-like isoform X1 n=2 Tax=Mya arenaria TaxID=6604 RepID=UPI0022E80AEC|nr:protein patched homolog 1-like isoform X1 [Mya arenaria]
MASERKRRSNKYLDLEYQERPSWVNARVAYRQVRKGKADGNKQALWVRKHIQRYLYSIGIFINQHCGKVCFVGLLLLSLCCVGLKSIKMETDIERLWVEEGGRLEEELTYTQTHIGAGSQVTNQILIQTPQSSNNVLTQESFLQHRDALVKASEINIKMFDMTWRFRDICYLAQFPLFADGYLEGMLEEILPCVIISPLDCFWEGSQALSPQGFTLNGFVQLRWENLNPLELVQKMKESYVDGAAMEQVLLDAGVSSGYVEKPCIDPDDFDCPDTAANYQSKEVPDFGAELTDGCYGFATKYMHWAEDLIVGGVRKNQSGHIVRAEALQSIILLLGEQQLFEKYDKDIKTANIDWTLEKARAVLEEWHRKFTEEMNTFSSPSMPDNLYAFSMTSLMDIIKDFSNISIPRVAIGYILMVFYACIILLRWNNLILSQSGIGIVGVLLIALSVAAGLGICSLLGITFNASTTQIIPFLALGLGVNDMFLITHTYAENANKDNIPHKEQTGECLKRTGTSILLTSVSNMLAFFSAVIIPIPALRSFALQAGILVLFNLVSVLLIYPAICSIDLIRRKNKRVDIFCCFESFTDNNTVIELQPHINIHDTMERESSPPPGYTPRPAYSPPPYSDLLARDMIAQSTPNGGPAQTTLAPHEGQFVTRMGSPVPGFDSATNSRQCLTDGERVTCKEKFAILQKQCLTTSLTSLAAKKYAPFLQKTPVKVFTIVFFVVFLIIGTWGTAQVKDGLDLTEVVPRDTSEYDFLEKQSKYFGYYNIYLVTQELDYPNNQRLIREFHAAFSNVDNILREKNDKLPIFWLDEFRSWLVDLQEAFDRDYANGTFHSTGWHRNASYDAILAFTLLVQTGDVDNSIDFNQVKNVRLVSKEGIIYPPAFYNYLTVWVSNDALAYSYTMAEIRPTTQSWPFDASYNNVQVPKAKSIKYAQIPFFLTKLSSGEEILNVVLQIRKICDDFSARGLPNYPVGVPFTFWEQYIHLRFYLMMALLCILAVTFIVLSVTLVNPWMAGIIVVVLTLVLVELFGFMGIVGLKLSAIPAVILISSVGIGVDFTVHLSVAFLSTVGTRNSRMAKALEHTFAPVLHGGVSTFLGVIMLAGAEFDFIVRYFFLVLTGLVVIGLLNGLLLLPVILSMCGPLSEVRPKKDTDRIPTPSPEASPRAKIRNLPVRATRSSRKMRYPQRIPSDLSLTTISEEPSQYSSTEIVVNPEVVVETSVPNNGGRNDQQTSQRSADDSTSRHSSQSKNSTPPGSVMSTPPTHHVTRVRATATVKVEVHTPIPGTVPELQDYKRRRRREEIDSDSDSSSSSSSS